MATSTVTYDAVTTHHVSFTMPDDVLGRISLGDIVKVTFLSREGNTTYKTLSYSDLLRLLEGDPRKR